MTDLLRLLHASLAGAPPAACPAQTQPRTSQLTLPPPAAHGVAFLQGAAWAAGLLEPSRIGPDRAEHLSSLQTMPALARIFGAGPAWQPARWTAAPRPGPAFRAVDPPPGPARIGGGRPARSIP